MTKLLSSLKSARSVALALISASLLPFHPSLAEPARPDLSSSKMPDHLVLLVFDQMRADYIERYNLKNFKRLQKLGTNYPNAIVGHSSAATIVSHLVLSTGLLPSHLPWSDDVMWDRDGILGTKDASYGTTQLSQAQIMTAMKTVPDGAYYATALKAKLHKKVFAVGEKNYAAITMGGTGSDMVVTLEKANGVCSPKGLNVPDYIASNKRFTLECNRAFGTEKSFYPIDGLHYYPGADVNNLGGDVWTADAVLEMMKHEDWGAAFITFGAIDKFGHMLGEDDVQLPVAFISPMHLEDALRVADQQLGRILNYLDEKHLLQSTLIIATADHGGQTDSIFLGNGERQYLGELKNEQTKAPLPFWLARLAKNVKVRVGFADTSVRIWLSELDKKNRALAIEHLSEIPQMTAIYERRDEPNPHYVSVYENLKTQPAAFQHWAMTHDQMLADSMASVTSADYIGVLKDNAGFGKLGDHGGNQENVQRIPMIVEGPGFRAGDVNRQEIKLVDVVKLIRAAFKIQPSK